MKRLLNYKLPPIILNYMCQLYLIGEIIYIRNRIKLKWFVDIHLFHINGGWWLIKCEQKEIYLVKFTCLFTNLAPVLGILLVAFRSPKLLDNQILTRIRSGSFSLKLFTSQLINKQKHLFGLAVPKLSITGAIFPRTFCHRTAPFTVFFSAKAIRKLKKSMPQEMLTRFFYSLFSPFTQDRSSCFPLLKDFQLNWSTLI